ncbi:MAG: mechanosensitive ion channel family protein [Aquabacterium sp.]|nr:MAG: mechanosensitive ion channel family protein [Aquabacterium sp.]
MNLNWPDLAFVDSFARRHPQLYEASALALQCLAAALAGLLLHSVADRIVRRMAAQSVLAQRLEARARRPAQVLLPALAVQLVLGDAELQGGLHRVERALGIFIILLIGWLVMRLIQAAADVVEARHPVTVADNLEARRVQTQVRVLSRTVTFVVGLLTVGSVLMSFPSVRQIGAGLLASAGVAGIAAGLAARPVLGNLIAGLQIAFAQPIRLDDVLVVEGEWGRVEEITSSYVVVRIWDDRRLVLPLEYFISTPFQNWTRRSADLIGTVFLWVDFRMPLEPLRQELQRVAAAAPEWDRRLALLQVTDATDRAMQLRILLSSADASKGWDLRCRVREALIFFMQQNHPQYLPQTRVASADAPTPDQLAPAPQPALRPLA